MTTSRFAGKVAIVTGAGRGMGRATALALARDGAAVVVNDVRRELAGAAVQEIEAIGGQALAVIADVSDEAQVQAMVDATVKRFGTVDILVNNAGILRATSPLEEISVQEWELMMAVNIRGVFLCTRAVLPISEGETQG